jgi:4-hydroxybenzoate polyprenyltransferase
MLIGCRVSIWVIIHERIIQGSEGGMLSRISQYLRMIKFSHSVFALPFALTAALVSAGGIPPPGKLLWIVVAMVGARSGAMGLNRVIDRGIDALNPRTMGRELPAGKIKAVEALLFSVISLSALVFASYKLNPLCLKLSPVAIAIIAVYSYTKRFTWMSHFVLGLALSLAPLGAWVAIRGEMQMAMLPLALAVLFWLPGFDILYALQDVDFDRSHGLFSIPARFGVRRALYMSRALHALSWGFLCLTGLVLNLGLLYWIGVFIAGGLFLREHSLVHADDLSRLDMAFFNMNGYISMTVFLFTLLDYLVPHI